MRLAPELTVSQVKVVGRPSRPKPHGVDSVVHVARYRCVVRHCQNHLHRGKKGNIIKKVFIGNIVQYKLISLYLKRLHQRVLIFF